MPPDKEKITFGFSEKNWNDIKSNKDIENINWENIKYKYKWGDEEGGIHHGTGSACDESEPESEVAYVNLNWNKLMQKVQMQAINNRKTCIIPIEAWQQDYAIL